MSLNFRQEKIAKRQKSFSFDDFIVHILSKRPLTFYKENGIFTHFPPQTNLCTVDFKQYADERSSYTSYGLDYDSSKDFIEQLISLHHTVPYPNIMLIGDCENSHFASFSANCKNTYLSTTVNGSENVFYSMVCRADSTNIYNSVSVIDHCSNVYQSSRIINSQNIFFSFNIDNCFDCWMSSNLVGCQHCIDCHDIENQSYCISNTHYSKEEFMSKKNTYIQDCMLRGLHETSQSTTNFNNANKLCTNITQSLYAYNTHASANICFVGSQVENTGMYNVAYSSFNNTDVMGGEGYQENSHVYMGQFIIRCHNTYYSQYLEDCSFCIGCIGLKNASYCILNKQYSKEDRYMKAEDIFKNMEETGILGDFLPAQMNPFYYNDTAAYLLNPSIRKEDVIKLGYLRRDESVKVDIPNNVEVVKTSELGEYESRTENLWQIDPTILDKIIVDEQGNYYRIVKMEYDFLMKYGLPLPRKHWLERLKTHFDLGLEQGN